MWISDMWAFNIAMAEAGLDCIVEVGLCQWSSEDIDDRPIVHYCYPTKYAESPIAVWDKRNYRPWEKPPVALSAAPRGAQLLLNEIDRIAAKRGYANIG